MGKKTVDKERIERAKEKALLLTRVPSVNIITKDIEAVAYYDPAKDLIVINEDIANNLSDDCLTYVIVHELVHKLTNTRSHGAKFLNKLYSICDLDYISRCDTEIMKLTLSQTPKSKKNKFLLEI